LFKFVKYVKPLNSRRKEIGHFEGILTELASENKGKWRLPVLEY